MNIDRIDDLKKLLVRIDNFITEFNRRGHLNEYINDVATNFKNQLINLENLANWMNDSDKAAYEKTIKDLTDINQAYTDMFGGKSKKRKSRKSNKRKSKRKSRKSKRR